MTPTEKALKTWYQPENPLYNNPEQPTIKLAGEIGELLDLYGKHTYKPRFDWMQCKTCKNLDITHFGHNNVPTVLDELGDIWYYLRILAWMWDIDIQTEPEDEKDNFELIKEMYSLANIILQNDWTMWKKSYIIEQLFFNFVDLLSNCGYTLDELTELNYIKLNSGDTNHGWKNA